VQILSETVAGKGYLQQAQHVAEASPHVHQAAQAPREGYDKA
jgi:hypothetical protein